MEDDTRVSLKEYFNKQLKSIREYFDTRIAGLEKVTTAVESRLQQYFDLKIQALNCSFEDYKIYLDNKLREMNEFRGALSDVIKFQSSTKDLEGAVKTLEAENKHLLELINTKADLESISFKIKANDEAIRQLEKYRAGMEAKASQTSVLIALAFSIIGIMLTLINMFSR